MFVPIEVELQIVCEDDIAERLLVTVELRLVVSLAVKVGVTHQFRLHIEDRQPIRFLYHLKVWRATCYPCSIVDDYHVGEHGADELLQGWTITVFLCFARFVQRVKFCNVLFYSHFPVFFVDTT